MNSTDDDTFIPDDDTPEEWLSQVFDLATRTSRRPPHPATARHRRSPRPTRSSR